MDVTFDGQVFYFRSILLLSTTRMIKFSLIRPFVEKYGRKGSAFRVLLSSNRHGLLVSSKITLCTVGDPS